MNHLGNYFYEQRTGQGFSRGQLARIVGYRNISKGANRIARFEREGIVTDDLLAALADALGIDYPTVERLIEQDRQEHLQAWDAWVSQIVPIQLVVRYMAAVYGSVKTPGDITTPEQAEAFACDYARKHRVRVCIILSRRQSVWIDEGGLVYARTEATPEKPNMPWMQIRSDKRRFLFEASHDQFVNGQIRQLQEKGKTPEEAAAILLDAQRLIIKACNKLLEGNGGRGEGK